MMYVVAYDIEDDKKRARIATLLKGFGQRVQHSVFECELSSAELTSLQQALQKLVASSGDDSNVRIYRSCKTCYAKATGIGNVVKTIYTESCIIL
ncbi:CRISPR-associated endonuclease Cas2 [Oleidesulfovibrio alaskensis]